MTSTEGNIYKFYISINHHDVSRHIWIQRTQKLHINPSQYAKLNVGLQGCDDV
jgi:hypothetical protein